tara:strand:- start:150 stop:515 length:366 start_codon:yes stop_codon:yes gene_type:complete
MNKPLSLSVKDYIIRKMSHKMMLTEEVINTVVMHQFSSANEALVSNKSVEISGFGKFVFNNKKAVSKMVKLHMQKNTYENMIDSDELSEQRKATTVVKLQNALLMIDILKPKIADANKSDL